MLIRKQKLTIIGAGPGGLVLAMLYSDKYEVTIIESADKIGGCWRINWEGGLFTEHAPKVGSGVYYKKLMDSLDVELVRTYNRPNIDFMVLFFKNFLLKDWVYFTVDFILIKIGIKKKELYVSEWMTQFSNKARYLISQISILIADIPEKVLLEDYMNSFSITTFYQLKDPEDWLNKIQKKLLDKGVHIILNSKIKQFNTESSLTDTIRISHDYLVSTVPPHALYNILQNCEKDVRYNWGNIEPILDKSFYSSVGFQLHYNQQIPNYFKKPLAIDSHIAVVIHTSQYTSNFTKVKGIMDTLSCTIINQKTTISQALEEIYKIVRIRPVIVSVNDLNYNDDSRIISEDTAFTRQKVGIIPCKGHFDNLFLVNSFNEKGISSMDKTIKLCYDFKSKKLL